MTTPNSRVHSVEQYGAKFPNYTNAAATCRRPRKRSLRSSAATCASNSSTSAHVRWSEWVPRPQSIADRHSSSETTDSTSMAGYTSPREAAMAGNNDASKTATLHGESSNSSHRSNLPIRARTMRADAAPHMPQSPYATARWRQRRRQQYRRAALPSTANQQIARSL